jgi:hypothetical protein
MASVSYAKMSRLYKRRNNRPNYEVEEEPSSVAQWIEKPAIAK